MNLICTSSQGPYRSDLGWDRRVKQEASILEANRLADLMVMKTFGVKLPHWIVEKKTYRRSYAGGQHCLVVIAGTILLKGKKKMVEISMELNKTNKGWSLLTSMTLYVHRPERPGTLLEEYGLHREEAAKLALKHT